MSLDVDRQIYVPTGSAAPDFYGAMRPGKNSFQIVFCPNANTGKLMVALSVYASRLVGSRPSCSTQFINGQSGAKSIPSIAQVTKQGFVFLWSGNRWTAVRYWRSPCSKISLTWEQTWPTQPIPVIPAPLHGTNDLTTADISPYAPNRDSLLTLFEQADKRRYAPPSLKPVLLLPGYDGAPERGVRADPDQGILHINSTKWHGFFKWKPMMSRSQNFLWWTNLSAKLCQLS